jgi:hypothetical protein
MSQSRAFCLDIYRNLHQRHKELHFGCKIDKSL